MTRSLSARSPKPATECEIRQPPHNIDAERAILSAILRDVGTLERVLPIIRAADFFRDAHRRLFETICDLAERDPGEDVDILVLEEALRRGGDLEDLGGRTGIIDLLDATGHTANVEYHARLVLEKARRRDAIQVAAELLAASYGESDTADATIERVSSQLAAIQARGTATAASPYASLRDDEVGIIRADTLAPEAVEWLWQERIARGKLALLAGEGGAGKSQTATAIVAAVTARRPFPDGTLPTWTGSCIILAAEDGARDTVIPRLLAAGADMSKILLLNPSVTTPRRNGRKEIHPKSFQDLGYWEDVFSRIPDLQLVVADPIVARLGPGVNDNQNGDVRAVLEPFVAMLETRRIACLGITHVGKSTDSRTPVNKILGSVGYVNLARTVHLAMRDPEDDARRFLCHVKSNLGRELATLAYAIEAHEFEHEGEVIRTSRVAFEAAPVDITAAEIVEAAKGPPRKRGPEPVKKNALAEWLFDRLASSPHPVPRSELIDEAGALGFIGTLNSKGEWTTQSAVYQALKSIPELPYPRNGRRVEMAKGLWCLVVTDSPF